MENEQQPKTLSTPSPLVPQGALPDSRGRSHIRIAVFSILAVHAVLLGTLLIFGCKKAPDQAANDQNVPADLTNNSAFPAPPPQMAFTPPQFPEPTATSIPPLPSATTAAAPEAIPQPVTAPAPAQTAVPQSSDVREHVVAKGESFYTIARKYNTTMRAVASANAGVDANRLKIGQKLVIPPPQPSSAMLMADSGVAGSNGSSERIHTVKAGDNLTTIARRHGVSIKDIQAANNLRTTQIRVGQKLRLPEKSNGPAQSLEAIPPLTPASSTAGSTSVPVLPQ